MIRQTGASTRPLCCTYGSKSFTLRVASGSSLTTHTAAVERAQRALLELRARAVADGRAAEEARHIEQAHRAVQHAPESAAVAELVE